MRGRVGEEVSSYPIDTTLLGEEDAAENLPASSSSYANGFLFVFTSSDCIPWRDSELLDEIKQQLCLAAPLIAASLFQFLLQLVSLMFAGHLGELALAGASMATSFANVTGFSLLLGMGSALDTLCGQAYGAKQYHNVGIHMQRAMLVLFLVCIPLAFIWTYTSQILMYFGQNPEISTEAGVYAHGLIPGLFAYGLLQCHIRFLQTQNIVNPILICSGITALMHIFVCWILVYGSSFGSKGASFAISSSCWINVSLLAMYVNFSKACKETWTGLSMEAIYNVLNFVGLAIPSALMICFEYWSFEMVVLLSGLLPNPKLETSVLSISLNTMWMVYMIPTGLGSAVSIRVSNKLGSGNSQAARLSVQAVFVIVIIQGLLLALLTILVRDYWGYLFSYEEPVVRYVSAMMPILATSDLLDGVQCALSGSIMIYLYILFKHLSSSWKMIFIQPFSKYVFFSLPFMKTVGFWPQQGYLTGQTRFSIMITPYDDQVFYFKQFELLGAARGCGWQNICSIINLCAYYVIGIPSAILIAFFFHVGGKGLWLGIICALSIQVVVLITLNLRTDWDYEARKARDRLQSSAIVATAF